jgi:hypothetical protein
MHIVGTDLALVIGHTVIALPYVVITVMVGLQTYDRQLDQAAARLGARPAACHPASDQGQHACGRQFRVHDVVRRFEHRTFSIRRGAEHAA